ncbi:MULTISPECIES: ABC transporter substrate-binding protein [Limnochorda]|uniref:ABC transporter substrate-binding protein n=1 Tax=Limnochorda TaxID=1676651 RepID=UPI001EB422A4|nr:ABC transporter substrate-binding protein [Limnochorda pilosa]MBO2519881.1 hypothetical protein [Bacillota bacterium]
MQPSSLPKWLRALGTALVALAVAGLLAALPAQAQGGTLRIAASTIRQLDPYKSAANDEVHVFSLIFDTLIIHSREDSRPVPHLAERWETPDPTTWIFHLRPGVYFQDGNPVFPEGQGREVTADDVVYSIQRFQEVSTAFTLGAIASVEALDRYTVQLKTAHPDPFLIVDPNRLARVAIVPREAIEQLGEDGFAQHPIGSGPFKLRRFIPDEEVVLERNEDYWLTPHLERVEFVVIPDPTVQTIALEVGEVDVLPFLLNIDTAHQLAQNPEIELYQRGGSWAGLGFNLTKAPFDEWVVRDAIAKALDIDAAFQAVVGEAFGERAYGQVGPWVGFGYDPSLADLWPHDPEGALAQLRAAGFADTDGDGFLDRDGKPLRVDIKTPPGSQTRVLTILATQLRQLGIQASVVPVDMAVWAADLISGNSEVFYDFSFAGTTGLIALFHSQSIGMTNTHFYANPEVDGLLDEASRTLDDAERDRLWKEAQRRIMQDRPVIPLYFELAFSAVNRRVKDWVPPWGGLHLVSLENNVWIEE